MHNVTDATHSPTLASVNCYSLNKHATAPCVGYRFGRLRSSSILSCHLPWTALSGPCSGRRAPVPHQIRKYWTFHFPNTPRLVTVSVQLHLYALSLTFCGLSTRRFLSLCLSQRELTCTSAAADDQFSVTANAHRLSITTNASTQRRRPLLHDSPTHT